MNKIILTVMAVCLLFGFTACKKNDVSPEPKVVTTLHNSQNSLDWAGTYRKFALAVDLGNIEVAITLDHDGTFELSHKHMGKVIFNTTGTFSWDKTGSIITLDTFRHKNYMMFKVGEGQLWQLDSKGNIRTGANVGDYTLLKVK